MTSTRTQVATLSAQQWHFFAASVAGFCTDDNLVKCICKQQASDKANRNYINGCTVWRVPVSRDTEYDIKFYAPQVANAFCIDYLEYPFTM